MKKHYNPEQQFFVTFAINEREKPYQSFKLTRIENETLGLHDTILSAENHELSDGEVAQALLESLHNIYSDNVYSHRMVSIINWWII